jgi:hypothetical protein
MTASHRFGSGTGAFRLNAPNWPPARGLLSGDGATAHDVIGVRFARLGEQLPCYSGAGFGFAAPFSRESRAAIACQLTTALMAKKFCSSTTANQPTKMNE